jgi:2-dehydro-3-deoxyphosphogluconate aldolase / (4S)-4-hydroxy-2-oxoglutarate aldolase
VTDFDAIFGSQRLMAILRGYPSAKSVELAERAWDLGISIVEVPVQTADAVQALRAVVAAGRERSLPVGAGTVITREQVTAAAAAGAAFTVAPGFDGSIVADSIEHGLPHLPGIATATELQAAVRHGLSWVKAFPATALGPAWFTMMRGPFPAARFVATGGLDASNAGAFLRAGVSVVAVGSALSDPSQLDQLAELVRGDPVAQQPASSPQRPGSS